MDNLVSDSKSRINLRYLKKCIKMIHDKEFVKYVLTYNKNPMMVEFESFGPSNPDKNICLIENNDKYAGFFAIFRMVLDALYYCERFKFSPVVSWTNCVYSENSEVNDSSNPFEYYFQNISNISYDDAMGSMNVVRFKDVYRIFAECINGPSGQSYQVSDEYIEIMSEIMQKYIRMNPFIESKILNEIDMLLSQKKTLGIHIRGTDFNKQFNNHPKGVAPLDYFRYIDEAYKINNYQQIFIATDDILYLNIFKEKYGSLIVQYNDNFRSSDDVSVAFSESKRYNHKFMLGYEVLRDMVTLSKCNALISGLSQVSICARISKMSYKENYDYVKVIDKGINKYTNRQNDFINYMSSR